MATHEGKADTYFGLIGLAPARVGQTSALGSMIEKALPRAVDDPGLPLPASLYADPSGARLRIGRRREGDVIAIEPSFIGTAAMRARLAGASPRPGDTHINVQGYFQVLEDDAEMFPVVAALADPQRLLSWPQDVLGRLNLTLLPHEFEVFGSEAEFLAAQAQAAEGRPKIAARAFFPTGLFEAQGKPAQPAGMFTGQVQSVRELTVELTGLPIVVVAAATLGGGVTMVANRGAFARLPERGNILRAFGFLSAQFTPDG
jgi:hypothetical protein